ncbi:MAG: polysaccharide deacetylase family protein [Eubacteriales bacterium]|nr:polysaccharide deacetylase family protein [Eubacteriales bacterium]MDY3332456.1 polysaccharide deacetylase family protein [Gallibacter sp.]
MRADRYQNKKKISPKKVTGMQKNKVAKIGAGAIILVIIVVVALQFIGGRDKVEDKDAVYAGTSGWANGNVRVLLSDEYMPNTSHCYSALKYVYKTKDVNEWMQKNSDYSGKKLAFLTFDDGPSPKHTETVLDTLKKNNVHGTFFLVGNTVESYGKKALMERYIKEGHAVGLHSQTHDYKNLYPGRVASPTLIQKEMKQCNEAIQKTLGKDFKTPTMRYPGGRMSWKSMDGADELLNSEDNLYGIDWNISSGDATNDASHSSISQIKGEIEGSGTPDVVVILMHDIRPYSVRDLQAIIDYLKSKGYEFGILS